MSCQEAERRMSLALDGMLPAEEEEVLQAHLAHCPACQVTWEAMQAVSHLLAHTSLASPEVDLASRVQEKLSEVRQAPIVPIGSPIGTIGSPVVPTGRSVVPIGGLVASWLGLALTSAVGVSALLVLPLLREPILVSAGLQLVARLTLTFLVTLRGLWLLATSLPLGWLPVGLNGCVLLTLMVSCLWAWVAFGRQRQRIGAT